MFLLKIVDNLKYFWCLWILNNFYFSIWISCILNPWSTLGTLVFWQPWTLCFLKNGWIMLNCTWYITYLYANSLIVRHRFLKNSIIFDSGEFGKNMNSQRTLKCTLLPTVKLIKNRMSIQLLLHDSHFACYGIRAN